jgi:hypothetical protein
VRASLADQGMEIFPPEQQTPEALGALQKGRDREPYQLVKVAPSSAILSTFGSQGQVL